MLVVSSHYLSSSVVGLSMIELTLISLLLHLDGEPRTRPPSVCSFLLVCAENDANCGDCLEAAMHNGRAALDVKHNKQL